MGASERYAEMKKKESKESRCLEILQRGIKRNQEESKEKKIGKSTRDGVMMPEAENAKVKRA